jgi:excisionase family DNA binding protein
MDTATTNPSRAANIPPTLRDDLLNGVEEIAEFLGRTPRETYHLLSNGRLPAFKLGAGWNARRSTLIEHFRRLETGGV